MRPTTPITLDWHEVIMAANAGVYRHVSNIQKGRRDAYGCNPANGWNEHVQGALGECAFAKSIGRFWSIGALGATDVGDWQVRATPVLTGHLLLHHEDRDDHPFVLVTGGPRTFYIVGWTHGRGGKLDEYWREDGERPCFWVPQSALRSFAENAFP